MLKISGGSMSGKIKVFAQFGAKEMTILKALNKQFLTATDFEIVDENTILLTIEVLQVLRNELTETAE